MQSPRRQILTRAAVKARTLARSMLNKLMAAGSTILPNEAPRNPVAFSSPASPQRDNSTRPESTALHASLSLLRRLRGPRNRDLVLVQMAGDHLDRRTKEVLQALTVCSATWRRHSVAREEMSLGRW